MPSLIRSFISALIKRILSNTSAKLGSSLLFLIAALASTSTAQIPTCPDPWGRAPAVYGIIQLKGTGTSSSTPYTQTINQSVLAEMKMVPQSFCLFRAIPGNGIGLMTSTSNINDTLKITGTCQDGEVETDYFTASGIGTIPSSSFGINFFTNQYSFAAEDSPNGVSGEKGCADSSLPGPVGWGSEQTWPMFSLLAGAPVLFGTYSYTSPALDIGGLLNATWTVKWIFVPLPDPNCKPCHEHRGSDISTQDQSLGEELPVAGTPFSLHYESSRSPGYAGADLFALLDAQNVGGWTLSIHHALEPLLQLYCAGGSCTPYALVPKALFLGDGSYRNDQDVQSSVPLNGNYYVTSEDGSEVYVFNPDGLHLQTLAPLTGAVIYTFSYDSSNRLKTITDANNNVTTIQRNANGIPTAIIAPFGQKTLLALDANGFLRQVTDPAGHVTKLTNSSLGLLSTMTDANGDVFKFVYDSNGRLTKDTDPVGGVINLARVESASGPTVTKTTALGRASSYQTAFSSTATQTSQLFTDTWENGLQATESDTQAAGQLSESVTLPDGTSHSITETPDPRWGIQLPIASTETITRGTLTKNITASRVASFTAGDPFSLVTQTDTKTVNGRTFKSVFTAANRTYINTTPVGRTSTIVLDAQERFSTGQLTGLALNQFTYDTKGRLASFAQGARKYTFAYDANGFLASVTDPLNRITSFTYDADGHELSATLPDGRVVSDTVDANGNPTSLTPPGGSAHAFTFSKVDLPLSYTPPAVSGSGSTKYSFNADRDFTKVTRADGGIITYAYDKAGRLTGLTAPTETLHYTYSATTGNLITATVTGGEGITYGYNGPLPTSSKWTGTVAGTVSRAYDNNFWIKSQGVTGNTTVNYTHDTDGLTTKAGALTITRNVNTGIVTATTLASTTDSRATNAFKELTSYTAKYTTTALYSSVLTRDNIGRVLTNTETIGGVKTVYTYVYDVTGRLTTVKKNGAVASSYTYDSNSNRLTATTSAGTVNATYDADDRLLTYGNASYAYTADGELTSKTVASQTTTYQYDALGNLIAVALPDGTHLSYIVDAESNRVGKEVNGVLVSGFLYDSGNLVAQLNASNQIVSQFVYSGVSNAPEYMIRGGVNYRIFSDQLGSPHLVVNSATGAIAERIDYDEFGNVINDTNPGFQPFGFAGGLYDQDTRLVRFGARDYDASIGRWTAKDPTLFRGGDSNLYAYVASDPINKVDPTGLEPDGTWGIDLRDPSHPTPILTFPEQDYTPPCPCEKELLDLGIQTAIDSLKITGAVGSLVFSKIIGVGATTATVSEALYKENKRIDEAREKGKKTKCQWTLVPTDVLMRRP
jgi:RHS repeat-associated protein